MKKTEWTIKGSPQTEGENQAKALDWKTDGVKPTVVLPCNVIKDSLMPSHQFSGTVFTGNLMRTEKESAIQTTINKGITGLNIEDSPPSEDRRVVREKPQDEENISTPTSFSPSLNYMGMWARSISNTSPTSVMQPTVPLSSSCSPVLCLSPPLPPCMELSAVLSNRTLTLDLYKGGTALLPILWDSIAGELRRLQYLRLGSEDQAAMQGALEVLPHLTQLRSLAIRGNICYDSRGNPLPGLLTTLPDSISSLSLLVHLDLSFNQLSNVPPCLLTLPRLSILILCYNQLLTLPPCFGHLASLSYLSLLGNQLESLPPSLGQLKLLRTLDLSYNQLHSLPDEIGALNGLVKLELSQNKLRGLPDTMGSLISLRDLSIQGNELRQLPQCLSTLPMLKIDVRNNPLGRPPAPPPLPPQPKQVEASVSELHLGFRQQSFSVSSAGCHVFLPGGAELLFPPGCLVTTTRLHWIERWPNKQLVWLEEHDFLLSRPLELSPHGIQFLKPVEVCLPYHRIRKREVVVRRFDGQSWSTLPTVLRRGSPSHSSRPGGQPAWLACCSVGQFSWFVAVSCLRKDSCSVTPEGSLLVSSVDDGIKLHFPPNCTVQTRTITLQVLQVSVSDVQGLCGDPQTSVSPLLCLSQTPPSMHFMQPIKVQIPLPSGITGHTVDMSCLHLLHGDPSAHTWTDITPQVSLCVTHLYAVFYITHFSWYWLWYTTQRCVSGVVRRVYQRLKQFRVQFLVLQRKTDPKQVLVQCLPANKVESRVQSLSEQYEGPQPSDMCDLLEGEQFFAGFEKGLDVNADRPDCLEGRLSFVFYSSLKNLKEVYICAAQGQQVPVRGQVSFYRGEIPGDLPEEVAKKRKGHDSQWLATLPIKLPAGNTQRNGLLEDIPQYPALHLGDPESGYLTEANLLSLSLQIGKDWRTIGINLGISYQELDRIQFKHRDNLGALVLDMLIQWARGQQGAGTGAVLRLMETMIESNRKDLAEEIQDIVSLGTRKYRESLKRVGLEDEHPSPSLHPEAQH